MKQKPDFLTIYFACKEKLDKPIVIGRGGIPITPQTCKILLKPCSIKICPKLKRRYI